MEGREAYNSPVHVSTDAESRSELKLSGPKWNLFELILIRVSLPHKTEEEYPTGICALPFPYSCPGQLLKLAPTKGTPRDALGVLRNGSLHDMIRLPRALLTSSRLAFAL